MLAWSGLTDSKTQMSRVQVGEEEGKRLLFGDNWRKQKQRSRERTVPARLGESRRAPV